MTIRGIISIGLVIFVLGTCYLFFDFSKDFSRIQQPTVQDHSTIIVLTGGKGRLSQALKLFKDTKAETLFIAGAGSRATLTSIFSESELVDVDTTKIVLEKESTSTYENAIQAKHFLIEKGTNSVILVTSNYHMKRAYTIFREVFPDNVDIISYAIESDNFPLDRWWKEPRSFKIAILEFLKYWGYRFIFLWRSHDT